MKIKKDELAIAILLPLAVGSVASYFTGDAMLIYETLDMPPLSPPGWIFPIVWTILYILMGMASYRVYRLGSKDQDVRKAMILYLIQLGVNFFWPLLFFKYSLYPFALLWLLLLLVLIVLTVKQYKKLDKTAAYLMIPYLIWTIYAAYLNLGIYLLK